VFLQFVIVGIGIGFIYVLFAVGMVLIYRESRVVNFAHGGFAAAGAYFFTTVYSGGSRHYGLALLASMLLCAALGWLAYRVVLQALTGSDELTMAMGTLGILTCTIAGILWVFGPTPRSVPAAFGADGLTFGSLVVTYHSIAIMGAGTALCAALGYVVQRTGVGRSLRAISENRTTATLIGIPVRRYDEVTWAIAGALAGFAGVMVTPSTGVSAAALVVLLVKGFAAALIGRFENLLMVVAGGLTIGVIESLVIWKFQQVNGLRELLAFALIAGALLSRERERVIA
jgi:branched-subunit amino acid ABC-type transport system permease component